MSFFDKETLEWLKWVGAFVGTALGVGIGGRRMLSQDSRARAKDSAETDVFQGALGEVRSDRDNWRRSAEDAWKRIAKLESENAIIRARNRFLGSQMALVKSLMKNYPEITTFLPFFTSDNSPLDSPPTEPPPIDSTTTAQLKESKP